MNIPLTRLYYFIRNIAEEIYKDTVIIYRFWPNGSKNINDLNYLDDSRLSTWVDQRTHPIVWCHDQEPLNYDFYAKNLRDSILKTKLTELAKNINGHQPYQNLNYFRNVFNLNFLLHSEKRSAEVKKYELTQELVPVYYWNHALLARDWFRYAEHEVFEKNTTKTFLIYNRAWSGTREYRLLFLDLLIENRLANYCQTTCNPIEPELKIHYIRHEFKNNNYRPKNILEKVFPPTEATADSSADFNSSDYNKTEIEIVLETLFTDGRLHLTEKSLRPIACEQPFILAATHSSLEYLRSYGFKTFNTVWNEQYDEIVDPEQRLRAIVDLMVEISQWDPATKEKKLAQAREIAQFNRQHFFSKDFFNLVIDELKTNFETAFLEFNKTANVNVWADRWSYLISDKEIVDHLTSGESQPTYDDVIKVLTFAKNRMR